MTEFRLLYVVGFILVIGITAGFVLAMCVLDSKESEQ